MSGRTASVHLALIAVQLMFGLHFLAAKVLLAVVPPPVWAPIRVGAAAVLMTAFALATRRALPRDPRLLGRLAFYSIFGVTLNQWLFVEGLARTSPGHSSILMVSTPIWTLFFAVLAGRERALPRKVASLVLATAGVLLVVRPAPGELTALRVVGDLMTLGNALSYALFLVISKRTLERTDAVGATAALLGFGALGMSPLALASFGGFDFVAVPLPIWGLGLLIVIFPTAGTYLLLTWALARAESSLVAFYIYLQPLIAVGLSALFFGERLTGATAAGAALIFAAVYLGVASRLRPAPALTACCDEPSPPTSTV